MIDIKYPEHFFNPLVSKHQKYYIELLLQTEKIIEDTDRIALERSVLLNELKRYIERNNYVDISDEEDYDTEKSGSRIGDDLSYVFRKFRKSGWIDWDDSGNYAEDTIFITDSGKELTLFLSRLMKSDEQARFVIGTYNNLAYIRSDGDSIRNGYISITNAYENTANLLRNLEMMYSKIRQYYDEQLRLQSPELILKTHFDGYINEVVNKIIFPLKVDDSVDRFKGPIIEKTEEIIEDSELIEKILEAAKLMSRITDMDKGRYELLKMLNFIKDKYSGINNVTEQLDEKVNTYTRVTRQKLSDMLSVDTTMKGNIISVMRDSADRGEGFFKELSKCLNLYDIRGITDGSFYKPRERRDIYKGEPYIIEDEPPADSAEVFNTVNTFAAKFTKYEVNEYAKNILKNKERFSSEELDLPSPEDYLMTMFLLINSTETGVDYSYSQNEGRTERNGYSVPAFSIKRKE